jgi:hypothetical protein
MKCPECNAEMYEVTPDKTDCLICGREGEYNDHYYCVECHMTIIKHNDFCGRDI